MTLLDDGKVTEELKQKMKSFIENPGGRLHRPGSRNLTRSRAQERDGAYRHLSLSASPQSSLETAASHHRTNSDTAPTIAKSGTPEELH